MITLSAVTPRAFVSSGWGRPRPYRDGWHEGLDFPAEKGSPVLAAADGIVSRVDNVNDSFAGNWIAIDHGSGVVTRYMHNTKNLVKKGDRVKRGQQIATVGTTGTSNSGPHVHFDVKLSDPVHAAYEARYGVPATGWGPRKAIGTGAPAETFMRGVTYSDLAREWAEKNGVVFYAGVGAVGLIAIAGAGYLAWRLLR
jgi:murein DD-endopeptidase MepM/ murein hydrolase activator NlpD